MFKKHFLLVHMYQNTLFIFALIKVYKFFRKIFTSNTIKIKSYYINVESVNVTVCALPIDYIYLHLTYSILFSSR